MPPIERPKRRQAVVYWQYFGINADGEPTVYDPVELDVRWEQNRREAVDAKGNPIAVDVSLVTGEELVERSIVWKGALADLPAEPTGLYEVSSTGVMPDIKERHTLYTARLKKHSDSLPEIATGTGTGTGT